jgi:hypothetical protein
MGPHKRTITDQTQLGRAIGQSGKKEADNAFVLFAIRTRCIAALAFSPNVLGLHYYYIFEGIMEDDEITNLTNC